MVMICYVRGVGDNYDRLFQEFFHHCLYIKLSSSLSKNDVNNKVRTHLQRTYRAPARVVLRLRTYSVKA